MSTVLTEVDRTLSYIVNYTDEPVVTHADGAYIYIGGRKLIDTSMGNGTHILGHNSNVQFKHGTLYGTCKAFDVDKYGSLLNILTGFSKFALCNTGAEATMRAARIARAATGKDTVVMFDGGWHGGCDTFLDGIGIPKNVKDLCVKLPYSDQGIEWVRKHPTAMVIVEPVQGSLPRANRPFLEGLRNACDDTGTLLCFDELITGFRLCKGGGKQYFKILPDLVTYGKIAGGGFPIGIVSGRDDLMSLDVRLGGTFSGNPASIQAGYNVLSQLGLPVYNFIDGQGKVFRKRLNMPTCGVESFSRILFTDKPVRCRTERDQFEDHVRKKEFRDKAFEKGVYLGSNGLIFMSTEHTHDLMDEMVDTLNSI